ncbi:hypothetical protein, partial [Klebsiella pneumoniae]|uniref:hypothetical protein n=1 Tax=Klebsiella pneumoniae TaxID=573 RepID=UPI0022345D00
VHRPCNNSAIMAIAPTTINIRRKSCIIAISVVPIHCHRGKHSLFNSICPRTQVQVRAELYANKDDYTAFFCWFFSQPYPSQWKIIPI